MKQTQPNLFQNPYSFRNKLGRLVWSVVYWVLFRPTPWFMGAWRSWLLRRFGATMGYARFHSTCRVWAPWELHVGNHVTIDADVNLYNAFGIRMGDRVVVSLNSFLCTATHDYTDPRYKLTGAPIVVGDDCWIAADAFIHPGVKIGSGAVVGARAVVNRDVASWTVVAGHPAKFVKERVLKDPPGEAPVPSASAISSGGPRGA